MLKREWGAECSRKLPHLFISSKTATLVPELAVEDLPLGRTATLVPEFVAKDLPLGRTLWWWWWDSFYPKCCGFSMLVSIWAGVIAWTKHFWWFHTISKLYFQGDLYIQYLLNFGFLLSSYIRSEGSIAIVKRFDFDFLMIFDSTSLPHSKKSVLQKCMCVCQSVCLSDRRRT